MKSESNIQMQSEKFVDAHLHEKEISKCSKLGLSNNICRMSETENNPQWF